MKNTRKFLFRSFNERFGLITSTSSIHPHILENKVYKNTRDFPRGPVVNNLPCKVWSLHSPGRETKKIPYAVEQLSPCATTREPACRNYWARAPQWNIPCAATEGQHSQRNKWVTWKCICVCVLWLQSQYRFIHKTYPHYLHQQLQ